LYEIIEWNTRQETARLYGTAENRPGCWCLRSHPASLHSKLEGSNYPRKDNYSNSSSKIAITKIHDSKLLSKCVDYGGKLSHRGQFRGARGGIVCEMSLALVRRVILQVVGAFRAALWRIEQSRERSESAGVGVLLPKTMRRMASSTKRAARDSGRPG
jgi:hypothetical protein